MHLQVVLLLLEGLDQVVYFFAVEGGESEEDLVEHFEGVFPDDGGDLVFLEGLLEEEVLEFEEEHEAVVFVGGTHLLYLLLVYDIFEKSGRGRGDERWPVGLRTVLAEYSSLHRLFLNLNYIS